MESNTQAVHTPGVTKIGYAKNLNQLLKGAGALAVIGSESSFKAKSPYPRGLPRGIRNGVANLCSDLKAGANGASASTVFKDPRRLVVAKVPDGGSRHLGVGRPDVVQ